MKKGQILTDTPTNGTVSTLKFRMDQLKISPRKLAAKIGVTRQRIYQVLSGEHPVRSEMAEEICVVLRCKLTDVFELQDNPKKIIKPRLVSSKDLPETLKKFRGRKKIHPTKET